MVRVKLGPGDKVRFFSNAGCPHLVVDTLGYTVSGTPVQGGFYGLDPARLANTRLSGGCIPNGTSRDFTVEGLGGVPVGADSVWLNITAVTPRGSGYLTVYPAGENRPKASTLNFLTGRVVPNATSVRVGAGGRISVYASGACADVLVDVVGYTLPFLYPIFF